MLPLSNQHNIVMLHYTVKAVVCVESELRVVVACVGVGCYMQDCCHVHRSIFVHFSYLLCIYVRVSCILHHALLVTDEEYLNLLVKFRKKKMQIYKCCVKGTNL